MARRDEVGAGPIAFRRRGEPAFPLAHPGGPFWAKRDVGAWAIPKGPVRPDDLSAETETYALTSCRWKAT
jgi:predicted NUDIX family NTP pyrophosphohydrolase